MIKYKGSQVKAIKYKGNDVKILKKGNTICWAKSITATVNVEAMRNSRIAGNMVVTSSVEPTQKVGAVLMRYTHNAQSITIPTYYNTHVTLQQDYPTQTESFSVPSKATGQTVTFNLSKGFPKPGTCVLTYQGQTLYDSTADGAFYAKNSSLPANASIDYVKQKLEVLVTKSSSTVSISLTYNALNAKLTYDDELISSSAYPFWSDVMDGYKTAIEDGKVVLGYPDLSAYFDGELCPYEGTTNWAKIICNGKTYYVDNNANPRVVTITGLSGGTLYTCRGFANALGKVQMGFAQFSSRSTSATLTADTTILSVIAGNKVLGTRPVELEADETFKIGYLLPPTITSTNTVVSGTANRYIKITNPNPVAVECTFSWAKKNNGFTQTATVTLRANATSAYYGNPCYDVNDGETSTNTVTVYLKKSDGDWASANINQSMSVMETIQCVVEETTTAA